MRQLAPGKTLIEAPTAGNSATCKSCAHCPWMAMNALQGVVGCLETGSGEIHVPEPVRSRALGCIERMLDFVKAHPDSDRAAAQRLRAEHRRGLMKFEHNETLEQARAAQHRRRAARRPGHRRLDRAAGAGRPRRCRPRWWCARTRCCAAATGSTASSPRWTRDARIDWLFAEGADMPADSVVCRIQAESRALLTAERPALNFLQLLSATATRDAAPCARHRGRVAQPARLRHPGHAQDRAGPAPGAEVRGARRRRPATSGWRCGTAS